MAAQPPKQDQMTFEQRLNILRWVIQFPSLTLIVIMRRDVGYRLVKPLWLGGTVLTMMVIAGLVQDPDNRPVDLFAFALLVLAFGSYQRFIRWREIGKGIKQQSYDVGTSCFGFDWLPAFMFSRRRIARFIDPAVCGIIGFILVKFSPALGFWLLVSALCLRFLEEEIWRRRLNLSLDTVDGMVQSEIQSNAVEHFIKSPGHVRLAHKNASGIPTGLGGDIQEKIKHRKTKTGLNP